MYYYQSLLYLSWIYMHVITMVVIAKDALQCRACHYFIWGGVQRSSPTRWLNSLVNSTSPPKTLHNALFKVRMLDIIIFKVYFKKSIIVSKSFCPIKVDGPSMLILMASYVSSRNLFLSIASLPVMQHCMIPVNFPPKQKFLDETLHVLMLSPPPFLWVKI